MQCTQLVHLHLSLHHDEGEDSVCRDEPRKAGVPGQADRILPAGSRPSL